MTDLDDMVREYNRKLNALEIQVFTRAYRVYSHKPSDVKKPPHPSIPAETFGEFDELVSLINRDLEKIKKINLEKHDQLISDLRKRVMAFLEEIKEWGWCNPDPRLARLPPDIAAKQPPHWCTRLEKCLSDGISAFCSPTKGGARKSTKRSTRRKLSRRKSTRKKSNRRKSSKRKKSKSRKRR